MTSTRALVVTIMLAGAGALPSEGQVVAQLDRAAEIRLAMSAGPHGVSAAAAVYVMREHGFEVAVEGTNGFACMVIRSAADRDLLAPHCFNPAAVETVVPAKLVEGELQARGLTQSEITAELDRRFEAGELPLPSGPAFAYMLSEGQQLGPAGRWKPHFMLYVPYVTNADIGGDPQLQSFPFVGPTEGDPHSTVVIVMPEFVDPAEVVMPRSR